MLTEWKLNVGFEGIEPEEEAKAKNAYSQELTVLRPAGPGSYTAIGKSEAGPLNFHGTSTYLARIPIQQGDHLGLSGLVTFFCKTTDPGDAAGAFLGNPPLGATVTEEESEHEAQIPVVAKIEPDVDGDGFGDETQDKCPQSAAYQTPCPVVTISSLPSVGKKATLTATGQTVTPGSLTRFTLTLTPQVTKALKALSTKKALTASIVASATNVTGSPSTSTKTVKLKGLVKPVTHHKKAHA